MDEKWMFQPIKMVSNTVQMATENFRTNAENIQTGQEKFWMGDAIRLKAEEKFRMDVSSHSNG